MELTVFLVRCGVYLLALLLSYYGLQALDYEKLLRPGHVTEARLLYALLMITLAYGVGSFVLSFLYRF